MEAEAELAEAKFQKQSYLDQSEETRLQLGEMKAERDRLREIAGAAQGFMSFVTWDYDVPGYPLNPDVGKALRNLRDALKGGE